MILGNPLERFADKADDARGQIVHPAEIVEYLPGFGIGIERIDREIAPRRILAPVVGIGNRRPSPIGGYVTPQGGDFHRAGGEHSRDRAMRDAGGNSLDPRFFKPR